MKRDAAPRASSAYLTWLSIRRGGFTMPTRSAYNKKQKAGTGGRMIGTGLVRNTSGGTCVCGGSDPSAIRGPSHTVLQTGTRCVGRVFPPRQERCAEFRTSTLSPTSSIPRPSTCVALYTQRSKHPNTVSERRSRDHYSLQAECV